MTARLDGVVGLFRGVYIAVASRRGAHISQRRWCKSPSVYEASDVAVATVLCPYIYIYITTGGRIPEHLLDAYPAKKNPLDGRDHTHHSRHYSEGINTGNMETASTVEVEENTGASSMMPKSQRVPNPASGDGHCVYAGCTVRIIRGWAKEKLLVDVGDLDGSCQSFSSDLGLVRSSRVSLHACFAAFSRALADLPLKRSRCGRK